MKKEFVKTICFIIVLVTIMTFTFSYCRIKDDVFSFEVFDCFYNLPDESIDVALIGGSGIREYYIAPEAYEKYGVASYALAVGNQPFDAVKYLIEEIEKTQKPKLYIIDIRALIYMGYLDEAIRRITDCMKNSVNRIKMINVLCSNGEIEDARINIDYLDFYFKFPMYHSQWEDVINNIEDECENVYMGYSIYDEIEAFEPLEQHVLETMPVEIGAHNKEVLEELLDYCDELEADVLFLNVPSLYDEVNFGKFNYSKELINERGYDVLDLNYFVEDIGIDYLRDFKNYYHVNVYGAIKVTDFLASYVDEKYELEDRKDCEKYAMWSEQYNRFASAFCRMGGEKIKKNERK